MRKILRLTEEEYVEKLASKYQTLIGQEIPDGTPMAPPIGYVKTPSMVETIRSMVQSELVRRAAEEAGAETFEEADDFGVEDEPDVYSGYEYEDVFEPPAGYVSDAEMRELFSNFLKSQVPAERSSATSDTEAVPAVAPSPTPEAAERVKDAEGAASGGRVKRDP